MSKLEDLVPPPELCKLIPAGEFEDSAFEWFSNYHFGGWHVERRGLAGSLSDNGELYPAPTLQEIMAELINLSPCAIKICKSFNEWNIECCIAVEYGERYLSADSVNNPATAALKLWLKLKGIEHE